MVLGGVSHVLRADVLCADSQRAELLVGEVGVCDWLVAVGAVSAWADAPAPGVAVGTALLAEVAGVAVGTLVDGGAAGG